MKPPRARLSPFRNLAEPQALLAQWEPGQKTPWQTVAKHNYQRAHAITALAGDHAQRYPALLGRLQLRRRLIV
ncbi:hypothetical protein [Roseateles sp.]|uniref:hypothetical protein n=1 Tax=Roseateles sp. TaxID=1971397 RepID=UPI00286D412A|nr:hypothetical protein [Roseateles sp.]